MKTVYIVRYYANGFEYYLLTDDEFEDIVSFNTLKEARQGIEEAVDSGIIPDADDAILWSVRI